MKAEKKIEEYARYSDKGGKKMVIKLGDWVWIHLSKNKFTYKRKSKLQEKGDGLFQVLKCMNYNAYKIALPLDYGGSNTFNVTDLTLCDVGTFDINLRVNSSQQVRWKVTRRRITNTRQSSMGMIAECLEFVYGLNMIYTWFRTCRIQFEWNWMHAS